MFEIALDYLDAGISIVPANIDDKSPRVKSLEPLFSAPMSQDFAKEKFDSPDVGIGIICGTVSGGLTGLDFDNHFLDAKSRFQKFCDIDVVAEILKKYELPIESTQSGGFHIFFRSDKSESSQKLASRQVTSKKLPDGSEVKLNGEGTAIVTLIETRGERSYTVCAPTKGYEMISGKIELTPTITVEEHNILLTCARSFSEFVDRRDFANTSTYVTHGSERPGDEYDKSAGSIEEAKTILSANGWTTGNGVHWKRPGKKKGISATFGKVAPEVFYVFSTNASPFEDRKAYTPWQIFAILEHNLDFESAAKALYQRGFGKKNDGSSLKLIYSKVRHEIRKGNAALPPEEINNLAEQINIPVNKVVETIKDATQRYADEKDYDKLPPIRKAEIFLKNNYRIRYDDISKLSEMSVRCSDWQDLNIDTIFREMQHEGVKFPMEKLKSLLRSNYVQRYNPFKEYFKSLPKWDGEDHIQKLASHVKVKDQPFFNKMFEKALVRNIACALEPNNYNRIVFTIISEKQEIGKSFFIQYLNPFGAKYYTDEQLKDNKDSRFALTENFIYNLEELDNLNRGDLGRLKATISTRGVKDRIPFAVHKEYFPRCCSFWGSTNREEFLVDDYNTRWLCFYVTDIDWAYSKDNIKKVWEQAWHLYNSKEYVYTLAKEEADTRDKKNDGYRIVDFELSIITKHLEKSENEWMSNAEIMMVLTERTDGKIRFNTSPQKLGRIMSQLGYLRRKEGNERGWRCKLKHFDALSVEVEKDDEEVPF
jgi:hypothetical protein